MGLFEFEPNLNTHMPFAIYGRNDGIIQTCCIMVDGLWKIHMFEDGAWKRISTGMPADATECSPFLEYSPMTDTMSMTFIAGASNEPGYMRFAMYRIDDLDHPTTRKIMNANCGFLWKSMTVHADANGPILIDKGGETTSIEIVDAEYNYRVTTTGRSLFELLATGQKKDGSIFTWLIDTHFNKAYMIESAGQPLYKPCLIRDEWYHCRKVGDGFEDRRIEKATNVTLAPLDWGANIRKNKFENPTEEELQ